MALKDWAIVRIYSSIAPKIWAATGATLITFIILYLFLGGVFASALLLFACSGILYHAQDNLLYHPELPAHSRVFVPVPSMYRLPYENVHIKSTNGVILHAFWLAHPNIAHTLPTVVYFHGNAGNMGHRLQNASGIFNILHCNVLLVEYRGYGLSTGEPSERGFYSDARAALDYLQTRQDVNQSQIILFGRSLGGAVALDVAADSVYGQRIMCLIVENTFTSIPDMAAVLIHPHIRYVPWFVYRNLYMSIAKVQYMAAPCLFVSGTADTLVPPRMMTVLFNKCGSIRKQLLQISGGSHNDSWTVSGYYQGLNEFISECRASRGPLLTAPSMTKEPLIVINHFSDGDRGNTGGSSNNLDTSPLLQHV